MRIYTFEDFNLGDAVFHKSNKQIEMVVIRMNEESRNITCRWINKNGEKLETELFFAELIKSDDYRRSMAPRYGSI